MTGRAGSERSCGMVSSPISEFRPAPMFLLAPLARHCSDRSPQSRSSLVLCPEGVGSNHSALLPVVIRDHKTDRFQLSNGPGGVAVVSGVQDSPRKRALRIPEVILGQLHEVVISGISTAASSTGGRPWPLTRIW